MLADMGVSAKLTSPEQGETRGNCVVGHLCAYEKAGCRTAIAETSKIVIGDEWEMLIASVNETYRYVAIDVPTQDLLYLKRPKLQ